MRNYQKNVLAPPCFGEALRRVILVTTMNFQESVSEGKQRSESGITLECSWDHPDG
jgi:hypothetical protein